MSDKEHPFVDGRTLAKVNLLDAPYSADITYDYFIPEPLVGECVPGVFVTVPFGGGNRRQIALVRDIASQSSYPVNKIKSVIDIVRDSVSLTPEQLELVRLLKETCFCSAGEAVRTIIPSAALQNVCEYYSAADMPPEDSDHATLAVYSFLRQTGPVTRDRILTELGDAAARRLPQMLKAGYAEKNAGMTGGHNIRYQTVYTLTSDESAAKAYLERCRKKGAVKQYSALSALMEADGRSMTSAELREKSGASLMSIKALIEAGIVSESKTDLYRDPYIDVDPGTPEESVLSAEQKSAADTLIGLLNQPEAKAALLHGVTGSGKTHVIKHLIDECVSRPADEEGNRSSAIVLVPEISLTPQTVSFFRGYYGDRVVVLHSGLSAGERYDAWRRMAAGDVDICVGTRSAVFAPFRRVGMIAIDEEQEHTYKSDMNPRYHARDIARFRCAHHSALLLLSSATPSLESYRKAETGAYTLVELNSRYGAAHLPEVIIADTREDVQSGNTGPVGKRLLSELEKNLEKGEQSILFLNRRGYNRFLRCPQCGEVLMCPHCSVALTYHTQRSSDSGYLTCHWCGFRRDVPEKCPSCGGEHLTYSGYGTQKAEEDLKRLLPGARVLRMDADSTSAKFSGDEILAAFRAHEADILLGTQMVTKGHDFPDVTLVGVLNADMSLYLDDYRANEATFDLLTQVIGRAGRADRPGRAVIQTFSPDHPVIQMAARQDYKSFYQNESALRRSLLFPPFCDIAQITLSSQNEPQLFKAAENIDRYIKLSLSGEYRDVKLIITGPLEPYQYKINDRYRLRFIIKCRVGKRTQALLSDVMDVIADQAYRMIQAQIDINPSRG